MKFKVGDKVRVKVGFRCINSQNEYMEALQGTAVTIEDIQPRVDGRYNIYIREDRYIWDEGCFEKKAGRPSKPTAKKVFNEGEFVLPVAKTKRDKEVVALVQKAYNSRFKARAVKVEMEGRMGRRGEFLDTRKANDYVLAYLSQFGLARKVAGGTSESYEYEPVHPLIFSRIYTDSETEWTFTIAIDKPEYALLLPKFVTAFNELKKANKCKQINVRGSGMHMSYMHQTHYPASDAEDTAGFRLFRNNAEMLLPALFFASTNVVRDGKLITRSIGPRNPRISRDKFNAIHYGYGALEFRVFDTCYENRLQILDNLAMMSVMVNKYWGKNRPASTKIRPIHFGADGCENSINVFFSGKTVVKNINVGLKHIKPSYLRVGDIKQKRGLTKARA